MSKLGSRRVFLYPGCPGTWRFCYFSGPATSFKLVKGFTLKSCRVLPWDCSYDSTDFIIIDPNLTPNLPVMCKKVATLTRENISIWLPIDVKQKS